MPKCQIGECQSAVDQNKDCQITRRQTLVPEKQRSQMIQCAVRQAQKDHAQHKRPELPAQRERGKKMGKNQHGGQGCPGRISEPDAKSVYCRRAVKSGRASSAAVRNGLSGRLRSIKRSLRHVLVSERKAVSASGETRVKSRWK